MSGDKIVVGHRGGRVAGLSGRGQRTSRVLCGFGSINDENFASEKLFFEIAASLRWSQGKTNNNIRGPIMRPSRLFGRPDLKLCNSCSAN